MMIDIERTEGAIARVSAEAADNPQVLILDDEADITLVLEAARLYLQTIRDSIQP